MKAKSMLGVIWSTEYSGAGKSPLTKILNKKNLESIGIHNVLPYGELLRGALAAANQAA